MPQNKPPKLQMVHIQAFYYLTQRLYAYRTDHLILDGLLCAPKVSMLDDSELVLDFYSGPLGIDQPMPDVGWKVEPSMYPLERSMYMESDLNILISETDRKQAELQQLKSDHHLNHNL